MAVFSGDDAGETRVRRSGFTLVELLVAIAIIAVLVSIMAPSMGHMEGLLKRYQCGSGMRQLGLAWTAYATANEGNLVGSDTSFSWDWIRAWGNMRDGALYPYVQTPELYKCTNPVNPHYPISYSMNGMLNGTLNLMGFRWRKQTALPTPSQMLMLVEEDDWRGYNVNSWVLQSVNQWIDYVAGNHDQGDNLVFCDGHVEYWRWRDPDTLRIPYHEEGFWVPDPGSEDLARLWPVYWPEE
ncbi:MAG: type II secretion system protein [Planctomycetota bacterium]|jgi:prepilin-type N-terminal cleavage/methylation domain-containing protein/prepilin-type processing-associated H-X9-DG protein